MEIISRGEFSGWMICWNQEIAKGRIIRRVEFSNLLIGTPFLFIVWIFWSFFEKSRRTPTEVNYLNKYNSKYLFKFLLGTSELPWVPRGKKQHQDGAGKNCHILQISNHHNMRLLRLFYQTPFATTKCGIKSTCQDLFFNFLHQFRGVFFFCKVTTTWEADSLKKTNNNHNFCCSKDIKTWSQKTQARKKKQRSISFNETLNYTQNVHLKIHLFVGAEFSL